MSLNLNAGLGTKPPACGCRDNESTHFAESVVNVGSVGDVPANIVCVVVETSGIQQIYVPPAPVEANSAVLLRHTLNSAPRAVPCVELSIADRSAYNVPLLAWGAAARCLFQQLSVGDVIFVEGVVSKSFQGRRQLKATSRTHVRLLFGDWFFRNTMYMLLAVEGQQSQRKRKADRIGHGSLRRESSYTTSSNFCRLCSRGREVAEFLYKKNYAHFQRFMQAAPATDRCHKLKFADLCAVADGYAVTSFCSDVALFCSNSTPLAVSSIVVSVVGQRLQSPTLCRCWEFLCSTG